jgi:hypothetical protein
MFDLLGVAFAELPHAAITLAWLDVQIEHHVHLRRVHGES